MSQPNESLLSNASPASYSDFEDSDVPSVVSNRIIRRGSRHHRPQSRLPTAVLIGCCTITGWLLGMATLYTSKLLAPEPDVFHPETLASGMNVCDCGSNIQEALQRNCVYDTLSTSWLPPYCRDAELTAKFEKSGDGPDGEWQYFADQEGTRRIYVEEIAALGDTGGHFWASRYWHRAHCLFYWQKQFRQRDTRVVMEQRYDGFAHVEHCSRLLLHTTDLSILTPVPVLMNSSAVDAVRLSTQIAITPTLR